MEDILQPCAGILRFTMSESHFNSLCHRINYSFANEDSYQSAHLHRLIKLFDVKLTGRCFIHYYNLTFKRNTFDIGH